MSKNQIDEAVRLINGNSDRVIELSKEFGVISRKLEMETDTHVIAGLKCLLGSIDNEIYSRRKTITDCSERLSEAALTVMSEGEGK